MRKWVGKNSEADTVASPVDTISSSGLTEEEIEVKKDLIIEKLDKWHDELEEHKDTDEKSTKSWWFAQGTFVTVIPAKGDWVEVVTRDGKKGFVKQDQVGPMGK